MQRGVPSIRRLLGLNTATGGSDLQLVIGCAKELAESVAKVVLIALEPDDNAQIIFETPNARGTPLLPPDLVKNAVFHAAVR